MTNSAVSPPSPTTVRRAATAGFLGTVVESYDFFVYTYVLVYTAPLFFPSDDKTASLLSSLLVLGAGFLTRPLGGLFFGWLGDRKGRRYTLMVTIVSMGIATAVIGLLPTHASIGALAPLLLVVFRLMQGFCAGGEQAGSTTFISEHTSGSNHGFLSSITPMAFAAGTVIAPGMVALTTGILSEETMADWGWRVPMLLSLPLTAVCLLLRLGLDESPEFQRLAASTEKPTTPVRDLLSGYWPQLLKVALLSGTVLMIGYIVAAFMPLFLQQQAGFEAGATATMATFSGIGGLVFAGATALVIDRLGRRNTLFLVMGSVAVLFYPILMVMQANERNFLVGLVGLVILGGLGAAAAAPTYASMTAVFPARVRYTGAALGFGLGSAIGGGIGPWLSGKLTETTGNIYAPAFLAIAAALIGMAVMATLPARGIADDDGNMASEPSDPEANESRPESVTA